MPRVRIEEDEKPEVEQPFHIKYRPKSLKAVIGHDEVVTSIRDVVQSKGPAHAYLFTGPAGTGKTTLARIVAADLGVESSNILEIDAASNSGIDAMKEIMARLHFQGFGENPNRAIIIDECHALSKQAWQTLLKPFEEPPAHVFFFLCTTETGKVPETIVTRCQNYMLKGLRYDDLMDLLEHVADKEELKVSDEVLSLIARAAAGSARQALVSLASLRDCRDLDEAERLLETPVDNAEIIELCRALIDRKLKWSKLTEVLKRMEDMSAESIRIVVTTYFAKVAMGASDKEAPRFLDILAAFSRPFPTTDKMAPVLLAFGDLIYRD